MSQLSPFQALTDMCERFGNTQADDRDEFTEAAKVVAAALEREEGIPWPLVAGLIGLCFEARDFLATEWSNHFKQWDQRLSKHLTHLNVVDLTPAPPQK